MVYSNRNEKDKVIDMKLKTAMLFGASIGLGAMSTACDGIAKVASKGPMVANGLRRAADAIENAGSDIEYKASQCAVRLRVNANAFDSEYRSEMASESITDAEIA